MISTVWEKNKTMLLHGNAMIELVLVIKYS